MILDSEIEKLSPKMQDAVRFVQYWNLSRNIAEFLATMGKSLDIKSRIWASTTAAQFRKNGVRLKQHSRKPDVALEYDYTYLQMVGERAMAEIANKKEEAELAIRDFTALRSEAQCLVAELRKFKDKAIIHEMMKQERTGVHNGTTSRISTS